MSRALRVCVHAPAKINLWLAVLGRREDGFHELDTGLLALELGDRLELAFGEDGQRLMLGGPQLDDSVPRDESNLVLRALHLAAQRARVLGHAGAERPLQVRLIKEVPSGGGLGGGSSDAAAALQAFERLHGIDLDPDWRSETLASLGSDCVFFEKALVTGFAHCKGRGERVFAQPPPSTAWHIVLITPEVAASTSNVFGALEFSLSAGRSAPNVTASAFGGLASQARRSLFNQLESAALEVVPELRHWRSALDGSGADHFRLTGSGSSFFGLYDEAGAARDALKAILEELERQGLKWRGAWVTRPAGRTTRIEEVD